MHKTYNRPWIPLDVVDCILEQLVDEDSDNSSTLKACSTVCRDFVPLCQKRIFAKVTLSDCDSRQKDVISLCRLGHLLSKKPQISDYIRTLEYAHSIDSETAEKFIFSSLRFVMTFDLSFLRKYRNQPIPSWSMITSSFKNALFSFLSSNNIVQLHLARVEGIPPTIFGHIPGLLWLTTDWVTLDISESEECPQLAVPRLKSLVTERCEPFIFIGALLLPRPRPLIDFSLLEDIKVDLVYVELGMGPVAGIISQSHRLKSIYIEGGPPDLDMRNNLVSCLHADSLRTLKSITLKIELESNEQDPYCHLPSELANISTANVIEEIKLTILVQTDDQCTTELQHWSSLDQVLSRKGGFPALQYVDIEVTIAHFQSDPEELESRLLFISDNAFPFLSTCDQVDFSMTVETYLV